MAVTAQMVKELREKTGAGMLDCKKALEETNGDITLAIEYLREKGIAKTAKKADRIAAEGLTNVVISNNEAVIYELNSETDFVSKNAQFLQLLDNVGNIILSSKATNTEEALAIVVDGKNVETLLADATATIGEKITLRRVQRIVKTDAQGFGSYKHMGGRISVLTLLDPENEEAAKDIAMHVAANNPRFLDQSQVDAATLEHEKHILTEQALAEGKPANIVEKMIQGRLNKFLQDICLLDQPFVKNPDIKVSQYLKDSKTAIVSYVRLEVGEGIEKRSENFADEVAAQLKK
ncbi:Elongation factor Ts (EF-Ts) [Alteracholeplasma palmae J233]|uniref:Elongation factor Ts n=1 Tax=Alteracholeplasma palmae (strain ATCC 49389 / J233) TaxID=1318466 RepID=U4KR43_ALTPJ|nr:translation elongation factor Ts [Alteracholeplasma palmae]CCV63851.1 Elongation factor Ts (EF-Ts) [Alteracholeplasma palmae J233]